MLNFNWIKLFFVIIERGEKLLFYKFKLKVIFFFVGLVVWRKVWLESVFKYCILSGRKLGLMLIGEDIEIISYI